MNFENIFEKYQELLMDEGLENEISSLSLKKYSNPSMTTDEGSSLKLCFSFRYKYLDSMQLHVLLDEIPFINDCFTEFEGQEVHFSPFHNRVEMSIELMNLEDKLEQRLYKAILSLKIISGMFFKLVLEDREKDSKVDIKSLSLEQLMKHLSPIKDGVLANTIFEILKNLGK